MHRRVLPSAGRYRIPNTLRRSPFWLTYYPCAGPRKKQVFTRPLDDIVVASPQNPSKFQGGFVPGLLNVCSLVTTFIVLWSVVELEGGPVLPLFRVRVRVRPRSELQAPRLQAEALVQFQAFKSKVNPWWTKRQLRRTHPLTLPMALFRCPSLPSYAIQVSPPALHICTPQVTGRTRNQIPLRGQRGMTRRASAG